MVQTATVTPNNPNFKGFSHILYWGTRRYEVYHLPAGEPHCYAYRLVGKRAEYFLLRNGPSPHTLFAVDSRGKVASVFRNEWFCDKKRNGQPCSLRLQD